MSIYIQVAEDEGEEPIELPCEEDGTMLISTLTSQFPGSSGLKYRNPETGTMRGLRLCDGHLQAPDHGWRSVSMYYCAFPKGTDVLISNDNLVSLHILFTSNKFLMAYLIYSRK